MKKRHEENIQKFKDGNSNSRVRKDCQSREMPFSQRRPCKEENLFCSFKGNLTCLKDILFLLGTVVQINILPLRTHFGFCDMYYNTSERAEITYPYIQFI